MSKQASPTTIGAFVVAAVVLLAVAVTVFGGAELFSRKTVLVTYFDGSVKGLREGSNVTFRGVRVGFVQSIVLLTDVETLSPKIEVVMELTPESIQVLQHGALIERAIDNVITIDELVEAGFSAQLESESFVTGQLQVELDFRPGQALSMYGHNPPHPEIPSVPSEIQQAIARFQSVLGDLQRNLDFSTLSRRVLSLLKGLDELANSSDLRNALSGLSELINDDATQSLGQSTRDVLTEAQLAVQDARGMIGRADGLLAGVDTDVSELMGELRQAAIQLDATLREGQRMLGAASDQLQGDSAQLGQIRSTLTEIEAAARSLRGFLDYLERHPEALIRGKKEP